MDDFSIPLKRCTQCDNEFPATTEYFFGDSRYGGNRLRARCRSCLLKSQHKTYLYEPSDSSKICSVCTQPKPATLEYFHANRTRSDGLRPDCKECVKKDHQSRQIRSRYPAAGIVKRCIQCEVEKPATTEHFYASTLNLDHLTTRCKQCSTERLQKMEAYQRNYYRINHARLRKHNKRYRQSHPEAIRIYHQRRRARKINAGGTHTLQDIQDQYRRQRGKCYYCKRKLEYKYDVDHVVPLARGGTDDKWNLVLACMHCNRSKNVRLLHEWVRGGMLL